MVNFGVPPAAWEIPRDKAYKGLGDMAFALEPGEMGLVEYHATTSPAGWHIVKRLE
jgi:hypothetical protein